MAYFKTTNLGDGIYYIYEMAGVGSHLIIGDEKAFLFDTGYGFGNLRREVKKVCKKPLVVVNSHAHADHSFGNGQFERVYISATDMPRLEGDYLKEQFKSLINYAMKIAPALRLILIYGKLRPKPSFPTEILSLPESMEFELGGRKIRFIEIPGHTPGSVVALDEKSETVFAGDAVNPGTFLFFDKNLRLCEYADRLDALAAIEGFIWLRVSHQLEELPFSFVGWYADFLRRVDLDKSTETDFPNDGRTVYQYTENSEEYGECSVFFSRDNL